MTNEINLIFTQIIKAYIVVDKSGLPIHLALEVISDQSTRIIHTRVNLGGNLIYRIENFEGHLVGSVAPYNIYYNNQKVLKFNYQLSTKHFSFILEDGSKIQLNSLSMGPMHDENRIHNFRLFFGNHVIIEVTGFQNFEINLKGN